MLRGEFASAGETTPAELRSAYGDVLAATIEQVGVEAVVERSGLDGDTVEAATSGDVADLSLSDAAAILAADPERPDAETIAAEARDILLLGMTTAVLDVEALASGINDRLEPKEIQQKIEGRHPMTLDEYALVHQYIESRSP